MHFYEYKNACTLDTSTSVPASARLTQLCLLLCSPATHPGRLGWGKHVPHPPHPQLHLQVIPALRPEERFVHVSHPHCQKQHVKITPSDLQQEWTGVGNRLKKSFLFVGCSPAALPSALHGCTRAEGWKQVAGGSETPAPGGGKWWLKAFMKLQPGGRAPGVPGAPHLPPPTWRAGHAVGKGRDQSLCCSCSCSLHEDVQLCVCLCLSLALCQVETMWKKPQQGCTFTSSTWKNKHSHSLVCWFSAGCSFHYKTISLQATG